MMSKLNPQTALDMEFSGPIEQTSSSKGRYPLINKDILHDDRSFMMLQKKREPTNLA
jgi:hypothetical protein